MNPTQAHPPFSSRLAGSCAAAAQPDIPAKTGRRWHTQPMTRRRLDATSSTVRRLRTLAVGLVLTLLGHTLTAAPATAGNAVGPQPIISVSTVGPHDPGTLTGIWVRGPPPHQPASATSVAAKTATGIERVVVGNGADLSKVIGQDQAAIQSAATRIGKPISLVGSRATGNISMASDYDYVVAGATKEDLAILRKALPSGYTGPGEPPGIDIFTRGLQPGLPYITFNP